MCTPGSPECRATEAALIEGLPVAGRPVYIEGGDLRGQDGGQLRLIPVELLNQLTTDARAELAHAIGSANRHIPGFWTKTVVANWRRSRPGFARLLDLTDGT